MGVEIYWRYVGRKNVCVQIFVGLYFHEFHKSTGDENVHAYSTRLLLQATIREIKIANC